MLPHLLESAREYPFVKYRDINSILTTNVFNAIGRGVAPQAGLEEAQRLGGGIFCLQSELSVHETHHHG